MSNLYPGSEQTVNMYNYPQTGYYPANTNTNTNILPQQQQQQQLPMQQPLPLPNNYNAYNTPYQMPYHMQQEQQQQQPQMEMQMQMPPSQPFAASPYTQNNNSTSEPQIEEKVPAAMNAMDENGLRWVWSTYPNTVNGESAHGSSSREASYASLSKENGMIGGSTMNNNNNIINMSSSSSTNSGNIASNKAHAAAAMALSALEKIKETTLHNAPSSLSSKVIPSSIVSSSSTYSLSSPSYSSSSSTTLRLPPMIIPLSCMYTPLTEIAPAQLILGNPDQAGQKCIHCGAY